MLKIILYFILILLITLFQIGFVSAYENLRPIVNLILVFLIIFTWSTSLRKSLPWVILAGLLLEFHSVLNFGTTLITLTLSVCVTWLVQHRLFRSESLFSLALILAIGSICYYLLLLGLSLLLYSTGLNDFALWKNINNWAYILIGSLIVNTILGLILAMARKIIIKTIGKSFLISSH